MSVKVPDVILPTGQKMPIIGIGTWRAYDDDVRTCLNSALEAGYRHIDTAFLYQNEHVIGEVLEKWFSSGKIKREDLFITTKLPMIANREKDVSRFLQKSLDMMKISYVDLYLVHNPCGMIAKDDSDVFPKDSEGNSVLDLETDLESVWKGMEAQVDAGKTKAIGVSNFNSVQIDRIVKVARIQPANLQIEIHAYHMQKKVREVCQKFGITVCAFAPMAAPYKETGTAEFPHLLEHPVISRVAKKHNKTTAQVLLRHLIQHGIIVIPKSAKVERVKQNFQVFDYELDAEDMASIDSLDREGEGRIFDFLIFKGINRHPEWPYHIPY